MDPNKIIEHLHTLAELLAKQAPEGWHVRVSAAFFLPEKKRNRLTFEVEEPPSGE